jgi:hypothetical protein
MNCNTIKSMTVGQNKNPQAWEGETNSQECLVTSRGMTDHILLRQLTTDWVGGRVKADILTSHTVPMPCPYRAHAVPMPYQCRAHAVHMPCPCRAHTVSMPCPYSTHTVSMPCPYRTHTVPMPNPMPFPLPCCAVNSHMPCRAPALLRQCRVLRESPRGSRKYPNC